MNDTMDILELFKYWWVSVLKFRIFKKMMDKILLLVIYALDLDISLPVIWTYRLVGWLVVLRIYVALAVFQPYPDLEAGDNQYLRFKWRGRESNPRPGASQERNHLATAAPCTYRILGIVTWCIKRMTLFNY